MSDGVAHQHSKTQTPLLFLLMKNFPHYLLFSIDKFVFESSKWTFTVTQRALKRCKSTKSKYSAGIRFLLCTVKKYFKKYIFNSKLTICYAGVQSHQGRSLVSMVTVLPLYLPNLEITTKTFFFVF